jgi:hypothetical protein
VRGRHSQPTPNSGSVGRIARVAARIRATTATGASLPARPSAGVSTPANTIAATETAEVLAREGIEVLRGPAVFSSPREVSVAGTRCGPGVS